MLTVDDLSPGQSLPAPIEVEVTAVNWNPRRSRRAEIKLIDAEENQLRLIDFEGAELSVDWKTNHRYRISRCGVQKGGQGFDIDLAPSKKTRIEPLGPANATTQLLVIGDTHVGRTEHPRTDEGIAPRHAFSTAIDHAISQDVDAVIHTGDIFHESATETHADFVDTYVFAQLANANIPFYYVTGNHSSQAGNEVLKQRTGTLATKLDSGGVPINSQVRVFGIDHHDNGDIPQNEVAFPADHSEPFSILVIHQTIEQLSGPSPRTVDLEWLHGQFRGEFDYIIAGHHHDASQTTWQNTPVMYTGAAEHMSTNTDPDDRVAWLLTIDNNAITCDRYDIP